jgi:iron complex outermembrane receptor protein
MKILRFTSPILKQEKPTKAVLLAAIAMLLSQTASPVLAQGEERLALEEITVTARKREESLQDVPIAITAVTETQLDERGVAELIDLTKSVPNFTFNGNGSTLSALGIRGIVAATRNIGFESGMGVYVDQVYVGRPSAFNQNLDDIQQVEVLRGPQGTLFGRNTIGGAVNITTKTPSNELESKVKLTAGNYNRFNASGFISGPIVEDKVYAKASLYSMQRDGFVDNAFDNSKLSNEDRIGYRASLRFTPTENLDITVSADDMEERTDRAFSQWTATDITSAVYGLYNVVLAENPATALEPNLTSQDFRPAENRDLSGQSVKAILDLESGARLVSITSQRDADFLLIADDDAVPAYLSHTTFNDKSELFTQELRWESATNDSYDYLFGIFYQDSDASASRSTLIGTPPPLQGAGNLNGAGFEYGADGCICSESTVETESFAVFVSGNYRFTEELSLALGLRYTDEEKSLVFDQTNTAFTGHPDISAQPSIDDSGVSGNISLSYATDNVSYYASVGKGFKSGGFNPDIVPNDQIGFDEETVLSYEIGAKSTLADGRVGLNAALFFTDYQDQQVQRLGSSSSGGTGFQISNADSEITGAELEITAAATERLELGLSLGLMDTEYTDFDECSTTEDNAVIDGQLVQIDCAGNRLSYVPDLTYNLSAKYVLPLEFADLIIRGEYSYKDDVYSEPGNFARTYVSDTDTINLRLSLLGASGKWEVSAWGKNIGDNEDEEFSWYIPAFQSAYSSYSIGSEYGIDLVYNF